jgi:DNA-directed RNA polymerase subunit K/omega
MNVMNLRTNTKPLKPALEDFKVGSISVEIEVAWIKNSKLQ